MSHNKNEISVTRSMETAGEQSTISKILYFTFLIIFIETSIHSDDFLNCSIAVQHSIMKKLLIHELLVSRMKPRPFELLLS